MEEDLATDIVLSRIIGRFLFFTPEEKYRQDPQNRTIFVDLITRLTSESYEHEEVRLNLAFNLPCIYKFFGKLEGGMRTFIGFQNLDFGDIYFRFTDPEF